MLFKITIYLLSLLLPFSYFTYKSYLKRPLDFDIKLTRRLYYIFTIVHIYFFIVLFHKEISCLNILKMPHSTSSTLDYIAISSIIFILSMFWESVFISCRSFSNIKFKDVEITMEELSQAKYTDTFQEKQINNLYSVLNAKIKMLKYVDYYIREKELSPETIYFDVLGEYPKKRKNAKVNVFYQNDDGLALMQKKMRINQEVLSSLLYSLGLYGFCSPKDFRTKDYIFTLIKTKYTEDDIIVVLQGDFLIDKEHLILINIIHYLELKIDFEISQLPDPTTSTHWLILKMCYNIYKEGDFMTANKLRNLTAMRSVSHRKSNYGLEQIKAEFSSSSKLNSDNKAVYGKQVLRQKIYSKI